MLLSTNTTGSSLVGVTDGSNFPRVKPWEWLPARIDANGYMTSCVVSTPITRKQAKTRELNKLIQRLFR